MMPTPAQLQRACILLGWSPLMVAWNAKTSHDSAGKVCSGLDTATVPEEHLRAIHHALEAAGIEFISENGPGMGVRLRKVDR